MSYEKLFQYAFEYGCGTPYEEVLQSELFQCELARRLSVYERHPLGSRFGGVLNAGHFLATKKGHAISFDRRLPEGPPVDYSPEMLREQALIRVLGMSLIQAAQECLSPEMRALAAGWKKADVTDRISLAAEFYNLAVAAKESPEQNLSDTPYGWLARFDKPYPPQKVLPKQFGLYGQSGVMPCCLGFSLLLLAWTKYVGTKAYLTNTLTFNDHVIDASIERVSRRILGNIKHRGLYVKARNRRLFEQAVEFAHAKQRHVYDFHPAILLDLGEGYQLYLDPYMGPFGFLKNGRSLGGATGVLSATEPVLPGMVAIVTDGGFLEDRLRHEEKEVVSLLKASYRLQQRVRRSFGTWDEVLTVLNESPEVEMLLTVLNMKCEGVPNGAVASRIMLNFTGYGVHTHTIRAAIDRFFGSPRYRRNCWGRLLTAFHAAAHNRYAHALQEAGKYPPPVFELAYPEFAVGLQVLSHLRSWGPIRGLPGSWFLKHSASPMYWHEACYLGEDPEWQINESPTLMEFGEDVVRYLQPYLHRRVVGKLALIDHEREGVKS